MRARQALLAGLVALSLDACVSLESQWRWYGISVQDESDIRNALHKITDSPIVELQPRSSDSSPSVCFNTADKKVYCAEKAHGKWQVAETVLVY